MADLLVDINDGIATLTFNRPEARNAQNLQMTYDLNAAFDAAVIDLPEPLSPTRQRISLRRRPSDTSRTANSRSAPRGSRTERPSMASSSLKGS